MGTGFMTRTVWEAQHMVSWEILDMHSEKHGITSDSHLIIRSNNVEVVHDPFTHDFHGVMGTKI